jgi:hypothetical protein
MNTSGGMALVGLELYVYLPSASARLVEGQAL